MPIIPLGNRLLVKPDRPSAEVRGIAVPEKVQDRMRPESGEVVSVSPDVAGIYPPGIRVAFAPYSGIELSVDGEPLVVLGTTEILGVIVDAAAS